MGFLVVTGMSGGGKTTVLKMLEDMGYYCVDNLPISLIGAFADLLSRQSEGARAALGLDVRAGESFGELLQVLDMLEKQGHSVQILFLEASLETLAMRYKETRRTHPLSPGGMVDEGVAKERQFLAPIRRRADYVIDTSHLLTRELKEYLAKIFLEEQAYQSLMVTIFSFGFKYGAPRDADLVFDVRFLPNPFYVEDLKMQTGLDAPVRDYVRSFPQTGEFLAKLEDMVRFLLPHYRAEGKSQLVIAIGCTGGKHRSVAMAQSLYDSLRGLEAAFGFKVFHRDIEKNVQRQ